MGYTNYLKINKDKIPAAFDFSKLKSTLLAILSSDVDEIILGGPTGTDGDCIYVGDNEIAFNGIGEDSYESCELPLCREKCEEFSFCKTAEKPYDKFVLACYFAYKHHLQDAVGVGTDGKNSDGTFDIPVSEAHCLFLKSTSLNYALPDLFSHGKIVQSEVITKVKKKKEVRILKNALEVISKSLNKSDHNVDFEIIHRLPDNKVIKINITIDQNPIQSRSVSYNWDGNQWQIIFHEHYGNIQLVKNKLHLKNIVASDFNDDYQKLLKVTLDILR